MRKLILIPGLILGAASVAFGQTAYRMKYPEPIQSPDPLEVPDLLTKRPYGYYNLTKKEGKFVLVIGYGYESAADFVEIPGKGALARVQKGGKYGFITPDNYPVVKCIYNEASNFDKLGYAMVNRDGKWGVIDYQGTPTVPCVYDSMSEMYDGWYSVSKGDEWGYVSNTGNYASSYQEYEKKKHGLVTDEK